MVAAALLWFTTEPVIWLYTHDSKVQRLTGERLRRISKARPHGQIEIPAE